MAAIVNRLAWMQAQYRLQADDRVLQETPYDFDVSTRRDPRYLAELVRDELITTVHFVPSRSSSRLCGRLDVHHPHPAVPVDQQQVRHVPAQPISVRRAPPHRLRGDARHRRVEVGQQIRANSSRLSYTTIRPVAFDQYQPE